MHTLIMHVEFRAAYGREDPEKLRALVSERMPEARLTIDPKTEDESARLRWAHPVRSVYGQDCVDTWSAFKDLVLRAWGRDATEENLCDRKYTVYEDGEPVGHLKRSTEGGGHRDYLSGKPIHCGQGLELLQWDGSWLPVRYEIDWRDKEPVPVFYVSLWQGSVALQNQSNMIFRWPDRENG